MSLFDKLFKKKSAGSAPAAEEPEKIESSEEAPVVNEPEEEESVEKESGFNPFDPDLFDQMFLKGFYSNESTFRNQHLRFPRFSLEHPATLGEVLSVLFTGIDASFKSLRVLSESGTIKEDNDPRSIAGMQLFPLLLGGQYGESAGFTPNVILLVGLEEKSPIREIVLHLKGTYGIPGKCYCMRVSLMVPQGNGPDSLHGCRPGTDESIQGNDFRHYSTSFLIMQDNCDIGETMRGYEECEASMMQKEQRGEEFTEMEKEIARGRLEMKDPAHGVGYGRWLMGEERWFDAFRQLSRIFWTSQRYVLNRMDDGGWVNTFVHLAHDVGKCLHKMGRHDEAYYYLSLAAGRIAEARPEYMELLAEMDDIRTTEKERLQEFRKAAFEGTAGPYVPKELSVGFMMQELFRAPEGCLTSIAVFRDGSDSFTEEKDARKTWDYPVLSLAEDGVTAVIGYSPVTYITKNDADKSILISSNVAIVRVRKAATGKDDDLFRFFVMIPPAPFDSDRQFAIGENVPEGVSFIVGGERSGWPETVKPEEAWSFANALGKRCRFLEGFRAARFVVDYSKARWDSLDDGAKGDFFGALFVAGFSLMDFRLPEKANYYLGIAAEDHSSQHVQEYINCLANSHDLRTLAYIDHVIETTQEEGADADALERWKLFLKRRKAYILSDAQRFVEAEVLLQELLNSSDEVTRNFAASELRYVIDEKRKAGMM